jgi:hypothetical protein
MKLESLLHSISRQELGMETLGESELGLLEWRMRALSMGECKGQGVRAVGGVWVYIELSQESSRWAQIQLLNKVWGRGSRTMSGWDSENLGLSQAGTDNV